MRTAPEIQSNGALSGYFIASFSGGRVDEAEFHHIARTGNAFPDREERLPSQTNSKFRCLMNQ